MEDATRRYETLRPQYVAYTQRIHALLAELLKIRGIDVVAVESRTKEVSSFQEKSERDEKNYQDPLTEITDLSGVRIITYYNEDVDEVCQLIAEEFDVNPQHSIDKRIAEQEDRFGYSSSHLLAGLSEQRRRLGEWQPFAHLACEIQIRSVLQHAWAAIDHKLRYKTKESIPSGVRRQLFRLSALLELADSEFSAVRDLTEKREAEIKEDVAKDKLEIEIDRDSLETYLLNSATMRTFADLLARTGFVLRDDHSEVDLAHSVKALRDCQIRQLAELDGLLQRQTRSSKLYKRLGTKLSGLPERQRALTRPAMLRLALVSGAKPATARKLLKSTTFRFRLHEALLAATSNRGAAE